MLRNVDTLSKSKDADEERRNRRNVNTAGQQGTRLALEWHSEEGETTDYLERDSTDQTPELQALDAVSVEKYLTYNNPIITSFTNHTFVSSALFAAKSINILPNNHVTSNFFSSAVNLAPYGRTMLIVSYS